MAEDRCPVTCFNCEHASYPHGVTVCLIYDEPILSEQLAAADCPVFDPLPPEMRGRP